MFLNNDVARIVGITQRQVLSWSEKGLVNPHMEATGAGTKRNYDYINLLEFGLCKVLFSMGTGVQTIKKILSELRQEKVIRDWAENFSAYYKMVFEENKDHYLRIKKDFELVNDPKKDAFSALIGKIIAKGPDKPEVPKGILLYFFNEKAEGINDYSLGYGLCY